MSYNFWTRKEVKVLKAKYPSFPKQELLLELCSHSWHTIQSKAHKLGIYRIHREPCTEETRRKISESRKGTYAWNKGLEMDDEFKTKISEANKKWWEENRETKGGKCLAALELGRTPEAHEKVSKSVKAWWDNPNNREKIKVRNRNVRLGILKAVSEGRCRPLVPNKVELQLESLLDKYFPGEWVYSGDGKITLEGFRPDFINCNGKKLIIELAGGHWHGRSYEQERSEVFRKFGYRTFVIWDRTVEGKRILRARRKWPEVQLVGQISEFMVGGSTLLQFSEGGE